MTIRYEPVKPDLPHKNDRIFLTDGGLETTLIFHENMDLPHFAAFTLINTAQGRATLKQYYRNYIDIAVEAEIDFILESATWRSSSDWGQLLGYDAAKLAAANHDCISLLRDIRRECRDQTSRFLISGCVGPRGDGYNPAFQMSSADAQAYHMPQIQAMAGAGSDMISAITITYPNEAIGITQAADEAGKPAVISFTVETDGTLPNGQELGDAIIEVDGATANNPIYYMINCAHPTHFQDILDHDEAWLKRIGGVRANASTMSHEELDNAETLDDGNPDELAQQYRQLRAMIPTLNVMGGCCGTDHRHVAAICQAFTNES